MQYQKNPVTVENELSRARNSHPSDCPGQVDFRSDNRKRSNHLPFGQVDFENSYW